MKQKFLVLVSKDGGKSWPFHNGTVEASTKEEAAELVGPAVKVDGQWMDTLVVPCDEFGRRID